MRRTAREDAELGGQHIRTGDKVAPVRAYSNFLRGIKSLSVRIAA
jgi:cytochrome P450